MERLTLLSSHADEGLARIKYILCHPVNPADSAAILQSGLTYTEGRSVFSVLLSQTATESILIAVPPALHVGYGVPTTAFIERTLKRVSGAPDEYVAARDRLSLYQDSDTEESSIRIEQELSQGIGFDQRPRFVLEPQYIVGQFTTSSQYKLFVQELEVTVRSFEAVPFATIERSLASFVALRSAADVVLLSAALHNVVLAMAESLVMTRLRKLRWQGLRALGYSFRNGGVFTSTQALPISLEQHRREVEQLVTLAGVTDLFTGELSWLKHYSIQQLEIMLVELDGVTA